MIWAPGKLAFLGLRAQGGTLFHRVTATDGTGEAVFFDYEMVETGAGWQIDGVYPVPSPDFGV